MLESPETLIEIGGVANMKTIKADSATIRSTSTGKIVGGVEPNGVHAWKGVRYAAPPVGRLRWRAPQPPESWTGVCHATEYGPMAPQFAGLLAPVPAKMHGKIIGEEDCLTLNIFSPAYTPDEIPREDDCLPVMVWIHGGGNAVGTSSSYDVLRNLPATGKVIVVSVNYRLGVLGWFYHPCLANDETLTPEERSGNFGTLDLIEALRWVQDNIANFGGDPANVTIFGESAGGTNVLTLLVSPLAKGLFHRAIAQSPVADTYSKDEAMMLNNEHLPSRRNSSEQIIARLQAGNSLPVEEPNQHGPEDVADYLRTLSVEALLNAHTPGSVGIYLAPRPIRDGVVLPEQSLERVFAEGVWNRVPIIIGSNRDEYRTFIADKPEYSYLLLGKVPILKNRSLYKEDADYLSRAWRAAHVDSIAKAIHYSGHREVWSYRFDWDEAPAVPFIRPDLLLGAAHGMEMAFVFGDIAGEFDIFGINTPFNKKGRAQLCAVMSQAWLGFADRGCPTLDEGTDWLPYAQDSQVGRVLVFDTPKDGGVRMAHFQESLAQIKGEILASKSLAPESRLRIYARLFLWSPLFQNHGSFAEYQKNCETLSLAISAEAFRPLQEI